jgi:hypothetical protein
MKNIEIPLLKITREWEIVDTGVIIGQKKRGCWRIFTDFIKYVSSGW